MGRITAWCKDEGAKLKEMNFSDKRAYIWEYYKLHIIGLLILVVMIGSLVNTWFINPPKKEFLYVAWMGGYVTDEQLQTLNEYLTRELVDDPENEQIILSTFFMTEDPSYNMAVYNRLMAFVAAGQLDIFIMDDTMLSEMASVGYLADLTGLTAEIEKLGDAAFADQMAALVKTVEYQSDEDSQPVSGPMALNLTDCPLLNAMDIYTQDIYLGVVANTQKTDIIAQALRVMYR